MTGMSLNPKPSGVRRSDKRKGKPGRAAKEAAAAGRGDKDRNDLTNPATPYRETKRANVEEQGVYCQPLGLRGLPDNLIWTQELYLPRVTRGRIPESAFERLEQ